MKLLSQLIKQFEEKHRRLPVKILISKEALVALSLQESVWKIWDGIPVELSDKSPKRFIFFKPKNLGVTVFNGEVRGFDA
jgi:hypothetical protein